ncbi:MAG: hypothetical protein RIA10_13615 [Amphiplicatus sp.]
MNRAAAFVIAAALAAPAFPSQALAKKPALTISIAQERKLEEEKLARKELEALLAKYDVERWLFTRDVVVESGALPHSHPVLTVNTASLGDEVTTLGEFLHEQMHWYGTENREAFTAAIEDLKAAYPDAPLAPPEGARDAYSTYLHLIVCTLEFDILTALFGEDKARENMAGRRYYRWIYRQILEDDAPIRTVMEKHGIALP